MPQKNRTNPIIRRVDESILKYVDRWHAYLLENKIKDDDAWNEFIQFQFLNATEIQNEKEKNNQPSMMNHLKTRLLFILPHLLFFGAFFLLKEPIFILIVIFLYGTWAISYITKPIWELEKHKDSGIYTKHHDNLSNIERYVPIQNIMPSVGQVQMIIVSMIVLVLIIVKTAYVKDTPQIPRFFCEAAEGFPEWNAGQQAGYKWACEKHNAVIEYTCGGNSESFRQGCEFFQAHYDKSDPPEHYLKHDYYRSASDEDEWGWVRGR